MSYALDFNRVLAAARPTVQAALFRYFRDLDLAEDAFQEASLRALKSWPENGPPRDTVAWLILVGRNLGLNHRRANRKFDELPLEEQMPAMESMDISEQLDHAEYRDDILRLLFVCCHPEISPGSQVALALRVVSGLTVQEIARAFIVGERAMEQRITRAKRVVGASPVPFAMPDRTQRATRLRVVARMLYLLFNEGYSASTGQSHLKVRLCEEAIRLTRLLLQIFPAEPELMGLLALTLLQHSRFQARVDSEGEIILLEDQDRRLWDQRLIAEAFTLLDKARRHDALGAYQLQARIAAAHARAADAASTNWSDIADLYGVLETLQPSPVVTLSKSVAVSKTLGPAAALESIEPLAESLASYFNFHGVRGNYLMQLGRNAEAAEAFDRAIALARTPQEAFHVRQFLDTLKT